VRVSALTSHSLASGGRPDHSEYRKSGIRCRQSGTVISREPLLCCGKGRGCLRSSCQTPDATNGQPAKTARESLLSVFSHRRRSRRAVWHSTVCGAGPKNEKTLHCIIRTATKVIHLEIVEDYTTAGFLAAFRRFVSRCGLPAHMYSDNGPNFHGADRELQTSFQALRTDSALQA